MDAINLILFAVLFVLQVAILILLLRRRSGDAGHQTELLARQLQAQDNERRAQIERLEAAVQTLREDNYRQQVKLLELVQNQSDSQTRRLGAFMAEMQKSNEQKLDQMRQTVDEKLTGTLNTRLNASFQTVSQQLESVYKSLGEMQKLSSGGNGKRQRVESGAYQCKEPRHLGGGAAGQYFGPDGAGYV